MRQANLEHLQPGDLQAGLQLFVEHAVDLFGVAAQRRLALVEVVVRILRGEVPHRRLALHHDEALEVLDVEDRACRVGHAPHHDGGDLDGAAGAVVDLGDLGWEVAHAARDRLAREQGQWVDPMEAGSATVPV
jgi:hypothetical protein